MHGHKYMIYRNNLLERKSKSIDNLFCTRIFSVVMDIRLVFAFNRNLHYSSNSFVIKSIFQKCILLAFAMYTDH